MQKNKKIGLVFLSLFFSITCQLKAQSVNNSFDSTTMSIVSIVINKSQGITIPDNIIGELKQFAALSKLDERLVLKNSIALKMLYNNNLSYNEKKVYLDWAIANYSNESKYLPVTYFKNALASLKP
jgi:hypothetical protein